MSTAQVIAPAIPAGQLSVRINDRNPNHHLFNNNGTWFVHCTVHRPDYTKTRVRASLRTRCVKEARHLRDRLLQTYGVRRPGAALQGASLIGTGGDGI